MQYSIVGLIFLVNFQLLSFLCALYVLFHCIKNKNILRCLPNHIIICLLAVSTWMISLDLVSTEFVYWNNFVPIQTQAACRFYNISFFSVATLNRMFMAFMSVERHFLVFRHQIYRRRRLKYILHYFPILLLVLWSFTYSIVTDVFLTCPQQRFRYTRFLCGYTCSLLMKQASLIYIWVQVFFPTLVTTIACILLPIRFMFQKKTLQRLQWRRARKMIIQMTVIAITYTISWIPYTVIIHLASAELLSLGSDPIASFMIFLPYIPSLLTPLICLHTISERLKFNTMKQIIYFCFPHRKNVVNVRTTVIIPNQNHTANLANTNLVNKRPTLTKS